MTHKVHQGANGVRIPYAILVLHVASTTKIDELTAQTTTIPSSPPSHSCTEGSTSGVGSTIYAWPPTSHNSTAHHPLFSPCEAPIFCSSNMYGIILHLLRSEACVARCCCCCWLCPPVRSTEYGAISVPGPPNLPGIIAPPAVPVPPVFSPQRPPGTTFPRRSMDGMAPSLGAGQGHSSSKHPAVSCRHGPSPGAIRPMGSAGGGT